MNLDMGPWESQGWWAQTWEACSDYHRDSTSTDPLWQHYLRAILNDIGATDKDMDSAYLQSLWDELPQSPAFTTHGQKVGFTRWFGWVHTFKQILDPAWHRKLVVMVWLGLQLGTLKKGLKHALNLLVKEPHLWMRMESPSVAQQEGGRTARLAN